MPAMCIHITGTRKTILLPPFLNGSSGAGHQPPMKKQLLVIISFLLLSASCGRSLAVDHQITPVADEVQGENPMVHQERTQIIDPDGKPLKLRGLLLEGWLQWNGPLWGVGLTSETQIKDKLVKLVGEEEFQTFRRNIYERFITERDIEMIARLHVGAGSGE